VKGFVIAILITAAVLGILLTLRFGLRVQYRGGNYKIWFIINFIKICLYDSTRKKKKKAKKSKKKDEKKKSGEKPKRDWRELLSMIRSMGGVVGRLIRRIRVDVCRATVTVGGKDAASAATNYGRIWAAIGGLHALLDNTVTLKEYRVGAVLDYERESITAEGLVEISFRNLYILAAIYGFVMALREHKNVFRRTKGSPKKLVKNIAD
jgi:hypothetical protein